MLNKKKICQTFRIFMKKTKQKTYNKGPENSSCVNLVLRNYYRSCQNTDVIKTCVSISIE